MCTQWIPLKGLVGLGNGLLHTMSCLQLHPVGWRDFLSCHKLFPLFLSVIWPWVDGSMDRTLQKSWDSGRYGQTPILLTAIHSPHNSKILIVGKHWGSSDWRLLNSFFLPLSEASGDQIRPAESQACFSTRRLIQVWEHHLDAVISLWFFCSLGPCDVLHRHVCASEIMRGGYRTFWPTEKVSRNILASPGTQERKTFFFR